MRHCQFHRVRFGVQYGFIRGMRYRNAIAYSGADSRSHTRAHARAYSYTRANPCSYAFTYAGAHSRALASAVPITRTGRDPHNKHY